MRTQPDEQRLGLATEDASFLYVDHPQLMEQQELAGKLRGQIAQAGSAYQPSPLPTAFMSPADTASDADSPLASGRTDASDVIRMPEGMSQRDFEEALAAAASLEQQRSPSQRPGQDGLPPVVEQQSSMQAGPLDAADVFRHCMSGAVDEVRRFLEQGGYADTVYKSAYGWDVGPDWLFTKPNDGTTVLNYVCTWTDVIGDRAAELVELLVRHGADMQRDDGLDQWFTPLHNAVANGARDVIEVLLSAHPDAVNQTTGDTRAPLHVLALCDDPRDRQATLELLLQYRPNLDFAEVYEGNTPLHAMAKAGHSEVVVRLLEVGAAAGIANGAGRTALQEAQHELQTLEQQGDPNKVLLRSRLEQTVRNMEIAVPVGPAASEQTALMQQVKEMGFDADRARAALERAGWNLEAALSALLG